MVITSVDIAVIHIFEIDVYDSEMLITKLEFKILFFQKLLKFAGFLGLLFFTGYFWEPCVYLKGIWDRAHVVISHVSYVCLIVNLTYVCLSVVIIYFLWECNSYSQLSMLTRPKKSNIYFDQRYVCRFVWFLNGEKLT